MAVLDELEERRLLDNVLAAGGHLRTGLDQLQTEYECMGDVRGHGLALGVDWVRDHETKAPDRDGVRAVVNGLKDRGFLVGSAGSLGNVLKLRPPLVFLEKQRRHVPRRALGNAERTAWLMSVPSFKRWH